MPHIFDDDTSGRDAAIEALRGGAVVAIPTDTIYGLAVALETPGGIDRLFRVKQRPPDKGIVLLLGDVAQASDLGVMTAAADALAAAFWPGGLTLVIAQRSGVTLPDVLTGGRSTIGLRVPDHDAPRTLARALGPLPVTSANRSGGPVCRDAEEIRRAFGERIELILDGGPVDGGSASTVVDVSGEGPTILRVGAIATVEVRAVLDAAGIGYDLADD